MNVKNFIPKCIPENFMVLLNFGYGKNITSMQNIQISILRGQKISVIKNTICLENTKRKKASNSLLVTAFRNK